MSTHLTKIWWDLNKHKLVEMAIPEAEIYKREWVGLTDEEMRECAQAMDAEPLAEGWTELIKFARAIEAKLKEKNT